MTKMAHFAKIDENGFVVNVIVVDNSVIINENGTEDENKGIDFLKKLFPYENCDWKQTSYNARDGLNIQTLDPAFRKNYACRGGTYDYVRDAFIPEKYSDRVVLDENTCNWFDPFIKNQQTPDEVPDDTTDYAEYVSTFVPENWEWDFVEKTWKNSIAYKKVPVTYTFDPNNKEWVEQ